VPEADPTPVLATRAKTGDEKAREQLVLRLQPLVAGLAGRFAGRASRADLEQGLPPLPHRYDHILCADILEHLSRPDVLLRQVHACLNPGGTLIASLPNSGNIWFRANIAAGRFPQDDKGLFDRTHLRFYTWKGWQRLFTDAGFRITSVDPMSGAAPSRRCRFGLSSPARVSWSRPRSISRTSAPRLAADPSI